MCDGLTALDILDAVETEEQRQTIGFTLGLWARKLETTQKGPLADGFQYLITQIRHDSMYFPCAYEGHSICYCYTVLNSTLDALVSTARILLSGLFAGTANFHVPKKHSKIEQTLVRPYPASLVEMVNLMASLGELDGIEDAVPKDMGHMRTDAADCAECQGLLEEIYRALEGSGVAPL